MKREIILTADGSTTIRVAEWDECYHSRKGAIAEAYHVFIKSGLDLFADKEVSILEMGFGTGLNAFITFLESEARNKTVYYTGVEAFPVTSEEAAAMNYVGQLNASGFENQFRNLHDSPWEHQQQISAQFYFTKTKKRFEEIDFQGAFDLVYFDVFGYAVQPELWSEEIFGRMFRCLRPGGLLVTYAARTIIKKNMESAGFTVRKQPGPPGKREMMCGTKPFNPEN